MRGADVAGCEVAPEGLGERAIDAVVGRIADDVPAGARVGNAPPGLSMTAASYPVNCRFRAGPVFPLVLTEGDVLSCVTAVPMFKGAKAFTYLDEASDAANGVSKIPWTSWQNYPRLHREVVSTPRPAIGSIPGTPELGQFSA